MIGSLSSEAVQGIRIDRSMEIETKRFDDYGIPVQREAMIEVTLQRIKEREGD